MSEQKPPSRRFRVGYALSPKKVSSFIQDSLVQYAAERGVDLVPIDPAKPLVEQGPFDCVIHKLYDQQWRQQLASLSSSDPDVIIIDPLEAIERLHNRVSMLEVVNDLEIARDSGMVKIPKQVFVDSDSTPLSDRVSTQGLNLPVIAKPLIANGSALSHEMCLVFNKEGLDSLKPPIVLQEFVNHGAVIFKVYVAGDHVNCVKRRSLPDISEDRIGVPGNLLSFSQISNLAAYDNTDESIAKLIEEAEMPPLDFVNEVATELRDALKLNLFNFDMIRDSRNGTPYLVIDINYFPGYAKMPLYETILTDFLLDLMRRKRGIET